MATGGDALVETLIDWGVDTIFGIPGDGINGVFEALRTRQDKIKFVQTEGRGLEQYFRLHLAAGPVTGLGSFIPGGDWPLRFGDSKIGGPDHLCLPTLYLGSDVGCKFHEALLVKRYLRVHEHWHTLGQG